MLLVIQQEANMHTYVGKQKEISLYEYMREADRMNMMNMESNETYETAPLLALVTPALSEEELHILFESAINSRLLAMREQMIRISGPLTPLPEQRLFDYKTDVLPFVHTTVTHALPVRRVRYMRRCHGSWLQALFYGSLGLMFATLGFDIMGLIVLYLR